MYYFLRTGRRAGAECTSRGVFVVEIEKACSIPIRVSFLECWMRSMEGTASYRPRIASVRMCMASYRPCSEEPECVWRVFARVAMCATCFAPVLREPTARVMSARRVIARVVSVRCVIVRVVRVRRDIARVVSVWRVFPPGSIILRTSRIGRGDA